MSPSGTPAPRHPGLNNLVPGWFCRLLGVFGVLILLVSTHALHAAQMPVALITDPLPDEARLMGEEVGFAGKLTPDILTGTYKWEVIAGTCVPTTGIESTFATTLKSEGAITVKLTVSYDSKDYEATVTIQSIKPKVTQLGWKDSIPLKKWNPKNVAIVNPVWIQPLNPNDPSKNEPGAYIRNQQAKANLRFEGAQALTRAAVVRIRGTCAELQFPETNTTYTFQNWVAEHLISSENLHDSVNQYKNLMIKWAYRVKKLDGINFGDWVEVNETSHKPLYTVHSYPCASPVYDFGLEKACGYVSGNGDFANRICIGVSEDLIYNPYVERPHGLENYDTALTGACCCHSAIFSLLISHVTNSDPGPIYIWGGCDNYTICYYFYCWKDPEDENAPAVKTLCSFQIEADVNGTAAVNQHYIKHVMIPFNGTMYDPSYGSTGWPAFLEFAPGLLPSHLKHATRQTGTYMMFETLSAHETSWYCPHSNYSY